MAMVEKKLQKNDILPLDKRRKVPIFTSEGLRTKENKPNGN